MIPSNYLHKGIKQKEGELCITHLLFDKIAKKNRPYCLDHGEEVIND